MSMHYINVLFVFFSVTAAASLTTFLFIMICHQSFEIMMPEEEEVGRGKIMKTCLMVGLVAGISATIWHLYDFVTLIKVVIYCAVFPAVIYGLYWSSKRRTDEDLEKETTVSSK